MFEQFHGSITGLNMNFSTLKQTVDRPFFYVIPTILVITIALFTKFGKKTTELGVPFYGNEEGNPEAPKKRWMKDALNLLREGYSKVCQPTYLQGDFCINPKSL